jgi:hypothetical protein
MPSATAKLPQTLFSLLTATLLAIGCSDSTAPSSAESAAGSPAKQSPSETAPEPGPAPTLDRPAPGSAAVTDGKMSLYTRYGARWNSTYTLGPGVVNVPTQAVSCLGHILGLDPVTVGATGGKSVVFSQKVIQQVWFYRWNGSAWVAGTPVRQDLELPSSQFGLVEPGKVFSAVAAAGTRGYYYWAVMRLDWYIRTTNGLVWTATQSFTFDSARDYYAALGSVAGPGGYCKAG